MSAVGTIRAELKTLPPLQKVCVMLAIICTLCIMIEGYFFMVYVLVRWGWGYSV